MCSSLLKRGVPPVKRAFLPTTEVSGTEGGTQSGKDNVVPDADNRAQRTLNGDVPEANDGLQGQWVPFHSACL